MKEKIEAKELLNLVAFCVLMENKSGIVGKSPDYIMEKYRRYVMSNIVDEWKGGLDAQNERKLQLWLVRWGVNKKGGI